MPDGFEQHFIRPGVLEGLLGGISFRNLDVVEFGAGRGALTRRLLDGGARSVEAWEIDPLLPCPTEDARLAWLHRDILQATAPDVAGRAVASFPPYATLPFLLDLCRDVGDLMLMVPPKGIAACAFMGMRVLAEVDGTAFEPTSKGRHLVMARGFRDRRSLCLTG